MYQSLSLELLDSLELEKCQQLSVLFKKTKEENNFFHPFCSI